jgi:two-component system nitrogen regulation sensor histidine kinase NtrY
LRQYAYLLAAVSALAVLITILSFDPGTRAPLGPEQLQSRIERVLLRVDEAAEGIRQKGTGQVWLAQDDYLFLFADGQLAAWSTNSFAAEVSWIGEPGQCIFIKTLRGDFLAKTYFLPEGEVLVGVVPLVQRFRITNSYLSPDWNSEIFGTTQPLLYPDVVTNAIPVAVNNVVLFHASFEGTRAVHGELSLWILVSLTLVFVVLLIPQMAMFHRQKKHGLAFLTLVASLGLLRIVMISFGFPARWVSTPVFDSAAFASSFFNPTIGDLFLNSLYVLIICLYLFYSFSHMALARAILQSSGPTRQLASVLCLSLAFFGFLYPFLYYETIFHNSSISLDWTHSLSLDDVRVLALVSVLIGSVSSFLFCHVWISIGVRRAGGLLRFISTALIPAGLIFFAYYWSQGHQYLITLITGSTYIIVLSITGWYRGLQRFSTVTYLYLLLTVTCLALQGSFAIRRFTEERSAITQYRFGQNFLVERDVLGEYLLQQASTAISRDQFVQSTLASPFLPRGSVRSKVKQVYLNSYFDRYDTEVHLFGPSGEPLDNQSRPEFADFAFEEQDKANLTGYRGIYFVDRPDQSYAKQYVAIVPVLRQGRPLGFMALVLSLKKIVPQSVFPELLVDNRFADAFRTDQYSYAIFQGNEVVSSFGAFNYELDFNPDWLRDNEGIAGLVIGDKRHVIVEGEGTRRAVVTADVYRDFYLLSNVALWILLGIAIVATALVLDALVRIRGFRLNYATRIQLLVFLVFVVPLVLISATTLTWTSSTAEERLRQDFSDRARQLGEQVAPLMTSYARGGTDIRDLEDYLIQGARLSGVDASIYSRMGRLVATNQIQIFDNLIVSNLINPAAFVNMNSNQTSFIEEERIGRLSYNNAYHVLRSPESGTIQGILSIPFFESGRSLERSRITILSNVMIVFMIILVSFTFLSLAATRWLTFPLRMITRSLSRTTLKEENKPLDWKSDDEIGMMVAEYNKMVANLEKSKIDLARSQKESAWREIAQQVAHEIKNPLTPMKLTVQQLDALMRNGELSRERAEQSLRNLLSQLEILNDIATSFSSFARMPAPLLVKTDAISILDKTVQLYADHPSGKVIWSKSIAPVWILGDDQLLSRIFSNLILNGLQSGTGGAVTVVVNAVVEGERLIISFSDNGAGIDPALGDKVFLPHFTTKKSGSGLGLAISRQGIEQSGGTIWFESGTAGTTFFISLPVHH